MVSADGIQVVIQGGAVGILLVFGFFGYRRALKLISVGVTIIANHMAHVEAALLRMDKSLTRFDDAVTRLVEQRRVDKSD